MKLATYQDGSRDGQLVVVSRDLHQAHYATGICNTMQQLLDDWNFFSPQLQDLYDALNQGAGSGKVRHSFPFDAARCMAPLPRIYQWAIQPEGEKKLSQQSGGDGFICAPGELPKDADMAYLTADAPHGASQAQLRDALRLAVRVSRPVDGALRQFAVVAVTLDELNVH